MIDPVGAYADEEKRQTHINQMKSLSQASEPFFKTRSQANIMIQSISSTKSNFTNLEQDSKMAKLHLTRSSSGASLNNLFRDPRDNSPSIIQLEQTLNQNLMNTRTKHDKYQRTIDKYQSDSIEIVASKSGRKKQVLCTESKPFERFSQHQRKTMGLFLRSKNLRYKQYKKTLYEPKLEKKITINDEVNIMKKIHQFL